jgi:hypothetical protein
MANEPPVLLREILPPAVAATVLLLIVMFPALVMPMEPLSV